MPNAQADRACAEIIAQAGAGFLLPAGRLALPRDGCAAGRPAVAHAAAAPVLGSRPRRPVRTIREWIIAIAHIAHGSASRQGAIDKSMVADALAGLAHGDDLGVRGRVVSVMLRSSLPQEPPSADTNTAPTGISSSSCSARWPIQARGASRLRLIDQKCCCRPSVPARHSTRSSPRLATDIVNDTRNTT